LDESVFDLRDAGARDQVIGEERFVEILAEAPAVREMLSFCVAAPTDPSAWKKKHCAALLERASALEFFLDDYAVRGNRRFVWLAEIVASLKNLAEVGHTLNHVAVRLSKYGVRFAADAVHHASVQEEFGAQLMRAVRSLGESLVRLVAELREETARLRLPLPARTSEAAVLKDERVRERVPQDLDQEQVDERGGAGAVILANFLKFADRTRRLGERIPTTDGAHLKEFVRDHFPETEARNFKAAAHNLQSSYDTWIKPTRAHEESEALRQLRGHVSLALHLFEVANTLVHFYERHEGDELRGTTKVRIAALVPPERVLEVAVTFATRQAVSVTAQALPLVQSLLPRFVQQQSLDLDVPDGGILHARPLSLIVGVVRRHGRPVEIVIDGEAAPASSLMGLILFVGKHPASRRVTFRGDRAPLEHLRMLFEGGLGERGLDRLPAELAYLKES
jgi:phosphotransferase system HPr-like phosphotransfer protein